MAPSTAAHNAGDLVLGIDCSTTASKAVAWDVMGNLVAEGRVSIDMVSPRPGWGEQRAEDWWSATAKAIHQVLAVVAPERIVAVSVTHQRETFVPVDDHGRPLRNGILWLDERSRPQLAELHRRFGDERLHEITGRPPSLTQSLPKLLWLVQCEPETIINAHRVLDVHGFLVRRLTGADVTSLPSADPMGIVDMRAGDWADEIIDGIGLRREQFAPIQPPGSVIAGVSARGAAATGLRAGTPVVAGAGDGQAACLGAGVTGPGRGYVNVGTAIAGGITTGRYRCDLAYRTCQGAVPGTYIYESVLRGGTATVSWFMDHIAEGAPNGPDERFASYERQAAELPPGAAGLMLVPYWNNVMNPYWDPSATGIVVGWNTSHRRHHLYRAILEGIAFEHRLAMDGIVACAGEPVSEHLILGGGSRSDLWCQIIADILNAPVPRARSADATNLGAAVLAAAGVGWFPDVSTAAAAMTGTTDVFRPGPNAERYDRLYREVYVHLFPVLQPYVDRLTDLTDTPPRAD